MQAIAVFNNKGGVGKTTLLCNLAAYLALHRKKKILIIDADPQCNATQSLFPDDEVEKIYENSSSFTIYSIVRPLAAGRGYTEEITPRDAPHFGVDIIVGDPRLALTEDLLARDWGSATAGDVRGLRTTMLFAQVLSLCQNYDYVFFDMGPSLGSINRSVLIASNFFISPMSIDIFSIRAIENISVWLEKWTDLLLNGLKLNSEPSELPTVWRKDRLRFGGYVTQQYLAKQDAQGQRRAVTAYERIMKKMPSTIKREIISKLQSNFSNIDYLLGTVPNLHSLVPMSQTSRKPIFELKAADGVRGAHFAKVRDAEGIFKSIAAGLERNLGKLA